MIKPTHITIVDGLLIIFFLIAVFAGLVVFVRMALKDMTLSNSMNKAIYKERYEYQKKLHESKCDECRSKVNQSQTKN